MKGMKKWELKGLEEGLEKMGLLGGSRMTEMERVGEGTEEDGGDEVEKGGAEEDDDVGGKSRMSAEVKEKK